MQFQNKLISLSLFLVLIVGCTPIKRTILVTSTSPIPSYTSPAHPTEAIASPTVKTTSMEEQASATPTIASTVAVTPTSTPGSTATPTSIPIPTLAAEVARRQLEDLIQNPNHCQLPCWLGIMPDTSTMEELKYIFAPFAALLTLYGGGDGISFELGQEKNIYVDMDYLTRDDLKTIEAIYISTQALQKVGDGFQREFKSPAYHSLLKAYSLSEILAVYGVPSKILLNASYLLYDGRTPLQNQQYGWMILRLYYPTRGILVEYEMPLIKGGEYGKGCPSEAFVNLWLTPSDNNGFYEKLYLSIKGGNDAIDLGRPIEESTKMGIDTFYETFRRPDGKCIETPFALWPYPLLSEP